MKGLDTPALLALLHGEPSLRPLLKGWQVEEIATTELNMLELTWIALGAAPRLRGERLRALERLRRRLTVLPIDSRTQAEVAHRGPSGAISGGAGMIEAIFAALSAAGCSEVLTSGSGRIGTLSRVTLTGKARKESKASPKRDRRS